MAEKGREVHACAKGQTNPGENWAEVYVYYIPSGKCNTTNIKLVNYQVNFGNVGCTDGRIHTPPPVYFHLTSLHYSTHYLPNELIFLPCNADNVVHTYLLTCGSASPSWCSKQH